MSLQNLLPNWILQFIQNPRATLPEISAGLMMAVLVIPQSLGYAALAGLPPIMGLYAAITPVLVYAYLGSSSVASVGPVAITAIMTASALSEYATGSMRYIFLAITLAFMVGVILSLASLLKLGWIMQFVSRGVASGFISGAAVLIVLSQTKHLFGIRLNSDSLSAAITSLLHSNQSFHLPTTCLGVIALGLLLASRYGEKIVWGSWLHAKHASFANRIFVIGLVVVSIYLSRVLDFDTQGIQLLQALPTGFPSASLPLISLSTVMTLLPSALLIALIAFISSSAIASHHARLRNEDYQANKELMGLGLANITSGLFGGFAVCGGISRTSLNLSVGANSPLASVVCAIGVLLILLFFGQYMQGLPYAILSAIIVTSVLSMIDKKTLQQAWQHDKTDAICFLITFSVAILFGLNLGMVAGLLSSFALMIYRTHQVHIAVLGRVGESEHFRNIKRYSATTFDGLLLLRIDESLYFGNAQTVHQELTKLIDLHQANDIVLIMTAVNHVDLAAQEMLSEFNKECQLQNKKLHFAEVKGPVMDILKNTPVFKQLSGEVFLSTNLAVCRLLHNKDEEDCQENQMHKLMPN